MYYFIIKILLLKYNNLNIIKLYLIIILQNEENL